VEVTKWRILDRPAASVAGVADLLRRPSVFTDHLLTEDAAEP
jgi:hypothetical protein